MSEGKAETSEPAATQPPRDNPQEPANRPVKETKPAGRWRRRFGRIVLVIVGSAVVFRLALSVLLPTVIHRTARSLGFDLSYGRLDLNLLGTQAAIWDVTLRAKDRAEGLLHADYAFGNVSSLALFKLKLRAYRLEVDGAQVAVTRLADGTIPLLEQVAGAMKSNKPPPPAGPVRFEPPLAVEAVRVNHVTVALRDESVSPPYEDTFTLGVRASDVGSPARPATLDVEVSSRSMLQALRLQGEADLKPESLAAKLNFSVFGLRLAGAGAHLAALGLRAEDLPVSLVGAADVSLDSVPSKPGTLSGTAAVRDVRLMAGQEDVIRLAEGKVSIAELSPSSLHVSRVDASGGLLRLGRTPDGRVTFASLSPGSSARGQQAAAAPTSAPATAPSGSPFAWRLDELVAKDLKGQFRDALTSPERRIDAAVPVFEVRNIASAGAKDDAATLKVELSVKDLAESVAINGKATPFADAPGARVDVEATGVRAEALRTYLAPLGIEPTLRAGRFRASIEASASGVGGDAPVASVALLGVRLDDGGAALLNMPSVKVSRLRRDPPSGALDIGEVAAAGPSLTVRRVDAGTLELPGFRYRPPGPVAAAKTAPVAASTTTAAEPAAVTHTVPVVRVGKLSWVGANIRLEDRSAEALEPVDLSDARVDLEGFVLDLRPDAPPVPPGKLAVRFGSPGLAGAVQLDGTLTPGRGSLAADVSLGATGLNAARLAPFLRPLGIEPRLSDGSLKLAARATFAQDGPAVRLAADVRGAELKSGAVRLLGLEHATVDRVEFSPAGYAVGDVTVTRPYARVERDADGGLVAAGVKLMPSAPTTNPAAPASQPSPATTPASRPAVAATQPAPDPFAVLAALPPTLLNSLTVESSELDWLDRAAPRPVELKLLTTASLRSVSLNRPQPGPAKYEVVTSVPGVAERLRIDGAIDLNADSLSVINNVDAVGLNPASLAAYMPAGMEPTLSSGAFKSSSNFTVSRHAGGGIKGSLTTTGVVLRGGDADAPLAALESLNVDVDRFDSASGDVALSRVALAGVELQASRGSDGALSAMGLRILPAAAAPPSSQPATEPGATRPAAVAEVDVKELVEQSKRALPLFSLDTLDVRLKRVSFRDDLRKAAPVALVDFRVWNDGPIRLLGASPDSNPPVQINVAGAVDPIAKQVGIVTKAAPFAERPTARVTVDVIGIDGEGLTRAAPELAERLDGTPLTDGRFKASLEAEANVRRRGPTRIDLSRGLEVTFALTQAAFRSGESGPVLAGVGAVRGEQVKVETRTGDVTVRSLDVTDLVANASRKKDGIYLLGMRLKGTEVKPDAPATPATRPQEVEAVVASHSEPASANPPAPAEATAAASKPEVRVDRLTVSGLDFRFEDLAVDPPVLIPITSLDAEVRGLSSLAMERERPVRFNVSVGAGKVSLPKKLRGGVLTGALGDLGKLAGGKHVETTPELEDRDFFAQVVAAGNVKLYPKASGRARAAVSGVELAAIRGLASPSGIDLGGGTFDARVDLKTRDDEKLDVQSKIVLTDLSVTEPPNGPIVRYLSLPAPLDAVIGAAEAADKSITLPMHFQVDGATPQGIGPAAVGAVSQVLVTAVASTPVKAVVGVAGLFGDTTKETEVVQEPPVRIEFAAGVASLDEGSARKLAAILARAKRDKNVRVAVEHELGQEDVAVAAGRANPPVQQVAVLAEQLRARRREMLSRREELLSRARAQVLGAAADGGAAPEAVAEYRRLQVELAGVDDALDRLYGLQRPGADREAGRRTRSAAIELADARLAGVRKLISASGVPPERIRVGTARFAPSAQARSSLTISVARTVAKAKGRHPT